MTTDELTTLTRPEAERLALTRWQAAYDAWSIDGHRLDPASIDVMLWDRQAGIGNVWPVWRSLQSADVARTNR